MLRKLSMVTAVAVIALTSTISIGTAEAYPWGWHGGWSGYHGGYYHRWFGPRFYFGVPVSYGYGGCYVRTLVPTPWGPRWRLVNRCY